MKLFLFQFYVYFCTLIRHRILITFTFKRDNIIEQILKQYEII